VRVPAHQCAIARHDCGYTRARAGLVDQAVALTDAAVPAGVPGSASLASKACWNREFTATMNRLAAALVGGVA